MPPAPVVFLGIKGAVLALQTSTGRRLWERPLKGQGFVTLLVEGNRVLAATRGELFCLDSATGEVLWHDPLRGYGWGLVSLATPNGAASPTAAAYEDEQRRAAASASAAT